MTTDPSPTPQWRLKNISNCKNRWENTHNCDITSCFRCVCVRLVTLAIICRIWFSAWGGLRTPSPSRRRRLLRIFLFFSSKLRLPLATRDWFLFIFSGVRASCRARRCTSQSWHTSCWQEETMEGYLRFSVCVCVCVCVCTWSCDADARRMSLRESPDWVLIISMISCFVLKTQ